MVQIAMNIYNDRDREVGARKWYPLKNTYAILGSNRNFENVIHKKDKFFAFSAEKWSKYISGQNTKTYYSLSIGYYLCLMKFRDILSEKHKKVFSFKNSHLTEIYQDLYRDELLASEFFQNLDKMIYRYLFMHLNLVFEDKNFIFKLKDQFGYEYYFDELSSGDQSLLFIILTIFGYDLSSGLLIIDEPELHLHPQMQSKFMELIDYVSQKYSLQVILATHSPLMINEHNIRHVYRFSKHHLKTQINNPAFRIHADDADLIHMLKYENIAKIFFVDKIIMVE
ncbi:MAG: ATP-binding protein [bacterium]|nr:ATP-binding protein [bacterium]